MNITNAGFALRNRGPSRAPVNTRTEQLPSALFVAEVIAGGLAHIAQDSFTGSGDPAQLAQLSAPILVRADPRSNELEALVRLTSGELALVDAGYGRVTIEVAAGTPDEAAAGATALRDALRSEAPPPERIQVSFWMRSECGGTNRSRAIDAPQFDEIADNYSGPVRAALGQLIATTSPARGRLILWRGDPGTGKSHALRALARAWAPWCSAHFIMDPEDLLGHGGAYLLDLLSWDGDDGDRWRLVILEDAGELIAADARAATGQGLSRLLNVADGLLGQGTRTLLLITTNEPVGRLHPATRRPGRCLADIEFGPLTVAEANAWLAARGHDRRVAAPTPLAELFAHVHGDVLSEDGDGGPAGRRFGFARALADRD